MSINTKNMNIYGWLFSYNPYIEVWSAFKKEDLNEAFNDFNSEKILKSSKVETLIELIDKTNGNSEKIKALLDADVSVLNEA